MYYIRSIRIHVQHTQHTHQHTRTQTYHHGKSLVSVFHHSHILDVQLIHAEQGLSRMLVSVFSHGMEWRVLSPMALEGLDLNDLRGTSSELEL